MDLTNRNFRGLWAMGLWSCTRCVFPSVATEKSLGQPRNAPNTTGYLIVDTAVRGTTWRETDRPLGQGHAADGRGSIVLNTRVVLKIFRATSKTHSPSCVTSPPMIDDVGRTNRRRSTCSITSSVFEKSFQGESADPLEFVERIRRIVGRRSRARHLTRS